MNEYYIRPCPEWQCVLQARAFCQHLLLGLYSQQAELKIAQVLPALVTGVAMLAMMIEAKINMDCIVVCGKGGSRSIGFVWTAHDLNIHQYQLRTLLEL